ncbi:MAG: hypothetical protein ABDH28_03170, partial [Brevinematia bacterium]
MRSWKYGFFWFVLSFAWVWVGLIGCKCESKVERAYSLVFVSPKESEVVTNEKLNVVLEVRGDLNQKGNIKVLINKTLVYLSPLKERISFDTQLVDKTNFLECVIEEDSVEVYRKGVYFFYSKPYVVKPKKVKYRSVRIRGIRKYEEVVSETLAPIDKKLEEKLEEKVEEKREYVSSISLVLEESVSGYYRDSVQVSYRVNSDKEFESKLLEYIKGVKLEISDVQDRKLFSEFFREPGLTVDLDLEALPSGTYILTAKVEDIEGRSYETSKWIKVDKTPPRIYFEDITNNTVVRGTFYFSSKFEDEAGIGDFTALLGKEKLAYRKEKDKVVFYFDSTKFKNGKNRIVVSVTDRVGNMAEVSLVVYIDNWFEEVVDKTFGAGFHIASFLDEEKNIYIAYYNIELKNLFFGLKRSGSDKWEIQVVDKDVNSGKYPSIFVDRFDRIHISYAYVNEKWDDEDLRYAVKEGKEWKVVTLDQQDKAGRYTSIVVDDRGVPHISYYNYTVGSLRYITYNIKMERWEVSVPDSYENVGSDTSIG